MAASKQASIHTHVRKAVTLVWGSLKLTPIRQPVSGKGEKWGKAEETRRKLPPCWFYTISLYYQSKLCNHGNHFVVKTTDLFYSDAHAVNVNHSNHFVVKTTDLFYSDAHAVNANIELQQPWLE